MRLSAARRTASVHRINTLVVRRRCRNRVIDDADGHSPWVAHRYAVPVPTLERLDTDVLRDVITTFRDTVRQHAGGLNRLNVYPVPDGDTGTNMARTLDAVVAEMEPPPTTTRRDVRRDQPRLADGRPRQHRRDPQPDPARPGRRRSSTAHEASAAQASPRRCTAASAGAYQAVLRPIEGTILTVVREAAEAAERGRGGGRLVGRGAARGARRRQAWRSTARPTAAGAEGRRRRRRRRRRLPAAARRRRCTSSTASRCPSPTSGPGPTGRAARAGRPSARPTPSGELDVSEQRYEVMYFLDPDDDRSTTSRRAGARSATRSSSSAATASGTATSTPTTSAPRSRPRSTSTVGRARSASPTCSRRSTRSTRCGEAAIDR